MNITTEINRENLKAFLKNSGQNKVGKNARKFIDSCNEVKNFEDVAKLWKYFKHQFKRDELDEIPKFERTAEEMIASKIYSGCSDIGTILATILREKGVPTVYLQSANIRWIRDLLEDNERKRRVSGHIFLEIYIGGTWVLFDSDNGYLYTGYDYNNNSLPDGLYAFSKSLNGQELGSNTTKNNNAIMTELFLNFDLNKYKDPNYNKIDLRKI